MDTAKTKKYRYFLYSKTQHKMREEVDKKLNKVFTPGKVINRGKWIPYTEISITPTNAYPDAKIVAEGYLEDMKFQNHMSVWGSTNV